MLVAPRNRHARLFLRAPGRVLPRLRKPLAECVLANRCSIQPAILRLALVHLGALAITKSSAHNHRENIRRLTIDKKNLCGQHWRLNVETIQTQRDQ